MDARAAKDGRGRSLRGRPAIPHDLWGDHPTALVAPVAATDPSAPSAPIGLSQPLVEAKLLALVPPPGIVARPRLLARILDPAAPPFVALIAGPGYGKTSLLAQLVAEESRPVAWLTLDDLDNDPAILVGYLEAAFAGA